MYLPMESPASLGLGAVEQSHPCDGEGRPLLGVHFVDTSFPGADFSPGSFLADAILAPVAPPPSPMDVLASVPVTASPAAYIPASSTVAVGASAPGSATHRVSCAGGRVVKRRRSGGRGSRGRGLARGSVPRCDRVWRNCPNCGHRNHVRRLFCASCFNSRSRG